MKVKHYNNGLDYTIHGDAGYQDVNQRFYTQQSLGYDTNTETGERMLVFVGQDGQLRYVSNRPQGVLVAYQADYDGRKWLRPRDMFWSSVETDEGIKPRFSPIVEPEPLEDWQSADGSEQLVEINTPEI